MNALISSIIAGGLAGALVGLLVIKSPEPVIPFTNQTRQEALSYEQTIIDTVAQVEPAVVSIVITKDVPVVEQFFEEVPSPFGELFGLRVPRLRENGTQKQEVGGGSGFIVSADGMVVTNKHVINDAKAEYTVFFNDGNKYTAKVIAQDPVNDLAILDIDANNLPYLEFANSDDIKLGQTAIAIGNALAEFQNSVSTGVISGLSRSIIAGNAFGQSEQLEEVIQTDAAINPGNSGGPLVNLEGKVIGVNVAVALGSENIGFSLPANIVKNIVESVQQTGKISRPYLGIRYTDVTPALQEANNLSVDYGILVIRGDNTEELAVIPGSPAGRAGIQEGDIILEIDGKRLDTEHSLTGALRSKKVGDSITLKILSQNQEKQVTVTLDEFPQ